MSDLFRAVSRRDSLFRAWRKIRDNGMHSLSNETRQEVNRFDADAVGRLAKLQDHLTHGRFEFRPQRGIAKRRRGKTARPLVVAAIENRIVQRSILDTLQQLPQIREILAVKTSIGGIQDRGREHAMALVRQSFAGGNNFFIRSDIKGFFTDIPRPIFANYLQSIIDDRKFIELFERAIATNLANLEQLGDDASLFPLGERGVAQGSPLSPLIGNILLMDFDRDLNSRGILCVRYIDDFLLMGPSRRKVDKAFHHAQQLLGALGLSAYEPGVTDKADSGVIENGFDFLGCSITPGLIQPTRAARRKVLSQIDTILDDGRRATVRPICEVGSRFETAVRPNP